MSSSEIIDLQVDFQLSQSALVAERLSLLALWQVFQLFWWVLNWSLKTSVMEKHSVCVWWLVESSPASHRSSSRAQSSPSSTTSCHCAVSWLRTHDRHTHSHSTKLYVYGFIWQGWLIAFATGRTVLKEMCLQKSSYFFFTHSFRRGAPGKTLIC